jgi:hypothetical protein
MNDADSWQVEQAAYISSPRTDPKWSLTSALATIYLLAAEKIRLAN